MLSLIYDHTLIYPPTDPSDLCQSDTGRRYIRSWLNDLPSNEQLRSIQTKEYLEKKAVLLSSLPQRGRHDKLDRPVDSEPLRANGWFRGALKTAKSYASMVVGSAHSESSTQTQQILPKTMDDATFLSLVQSMLAETSPPDEACETLQLACRRLAAYVSSIVDVVVQQVEVYDREAFQHKLRRDATNELKSALDTSRFQFLQAISNSFRRDPNR